MIALAVMLVMGIILASLTSFLDANQRSAKGYRAQREDTYAGDGAMKTAINWLSTDPNLGRDPSLSTTDPDCIYDVPTEAGIVTVNCAAETGSGSGAPNDPGQVPPEAILTLGNRKTNNAANADDGDEPGPYNVPDCEGWWNTVQGWFRTGTNPDLTGPGEWALQIEGRKGLGLLNTTCNATKPRAKSPNMLIEGDVISAGRMQNRIAGTTLSVANGSLLARHGCSAGFSAGCGAPGTRSFPAGDPLAYLNGTKQDEDPARLNPSAPNAIGDIRSQWLPVGFKADGSLADGASLPNRTTAYLLNQDGTVTAANPAAACGSGAATIVFLPGWYRTAEVVNQYTARSGCNDKTFWFAPEPGPDGKLLTDDDVTGAYYFDFTGAGAAQRCGSMNNPSSIRWCVGNSNSQNARIVGGTPNGWSPLGATTAPPAGASDPRDRIRVSTEAATVVDRDLSQSWYNADNAKVLDGNPARYTATGCIPFIGCISQDRAIRVREFTPKFTSPPIDEVGGVDGPAPRGRVYVRVSYGITNPNSANHAKLHIRAVGKESGPRECGTFDLFTNKSDADYNAGGVKTYTFNAAQAADLATECGSVDHLNGLELKLLVTGNGTNNPKTDVYFDGAEIFYDTFEGANFPNPDKNPKITDAAVSDCDPKRPGAQFIFGGESHAYVADGSMEVCAGPYPTDPENHQNIALYGVPAVPDVLPTAVIQRGGNQGRDTTLHNEGNVKAIDKKVMTIEYYGKAGFGGDYAEGWARLKMGGYSPPPGYEVTKIAARVSYNPKNQGCTFLWECLGAEPLLRFPQSACGDVKFPKNPDRGPIQVANFKNAIVYEKGGKNCVSPTQLASGAELTWVARAECFLGICNPGGGWYKDELDGMALEITIAPTNTSVPRLRPQSGCITAHPNYNVGEGLPDCAIILADTASSDDKFSWPWQQKEGEWRGRASFRGTVYAPSAAIEIDDTDVAYPLSDRGIILRHLRFSGFAYRGAYDGKAISNNLDKTRAPREMNLVACKQSDGRRTLPVAQRDCDPDKGDIVLTRARVRFSGDQSEKPELVWWVDDR